MKDGEPVHTTRVVVGRPTNQTPVFSDEIEDIVVNPYWNVPPSIATKEIKPHLHRQSGLSRQPEHGDAVGQQGRSTPRPSTGPPPTSTTTTSARSRAALNALGQIKFLFPNDHDVYLHDTPSKSLFARSYRAYSHGCVRVQNPMDFAGALLATNPEHHRGLAQGACSATPRSGCTLKNHIPVHLMYFTLRVDDDGTIRSYGDVYGHNKKLIELLNG